MVLVLAPPLHLLVLLGFVRDLCNSRYLRYFMENEIDIQILLTDVLTNLLAYMYVL